ncbi:MAG: class I fructose-bisphosphate aldolase [Ferrimicrobium sp.]
MYEQERDIAGSLVAVGRGILAADESSPTLTKRFDRLGIESTPESRRQWRELLLSTEGLAQWISGVILYDETFYQRASDGSSFPEFCAAHGVIPGIKVDTGAKPLAGRPGEFVTEGLDGLSARCAAYYAGGARFAKWRAVLTIADRRPSSMCLDANAHALARYAKICQSEGLVPIVEPEVLMEGAHSLDECFTVTSRVLAATFDALRRFDVAFDAMILKPSMVTPGSSGKAVSVDEVAESTVACFRNEVPASVAGIALLSGGQCDEAATAHLGAINRVGALPWSVTFSFGRALQDTPLGVWKGHLESVGAAQASLIKRAMANAAVARPSQA